MKLGKWLKTVDCMFDVAIWSQYSRENEPDWEGNAFDIPWTFMDKEIGFIEDQDDGEPPIYFAPYTNEHGANLVKVVINIIEK